MPDLQVNFGELQSLGALMTSVIASIEGVKSSASAGADIIGDHGVADALHEFGHNWDHQRGEFTRRAKKIAEMVTEAGARYADIEGQLVTGMTDSGGS